MFCMTISVITTETGEPIAAFTVQLFVVFASLYWKYVEVKQRLSRSLMSSVGSGSSTVEFLIAFAVQSRASWSGILVNSDFTSKDSSLWSSGIRIVLMVSIRFSVDCSLCLDSSVSGFGTFQYSKNRNQQLPALYKRLIDEIKQN